MQIEMPPREALPDLTDAEYALMESRMSKGCQTCTECVGYTHHWIECWDETTQTDYVCRHCEVLGNVCDACWGTIEGCEFCGGEGVIAVDVDLN